MVEKYSVVNDVHVHIGQSSDIVAEIDLRILLNFKQLHGIHKMLIMGSDVSPITDNVTVTNLINSNPDIYGLYWYAHNAKPDMLKLTDKMIGIKYHGVYNDMPVTEMSKNMLEGLDKLKKVLLIHCGRYLEGDIKSHSSYLHGIAVARQYPNIKVILAHMGGTDTTVCKKAITHAADLFNVYFDTSGITTPSIIEYACDKISSDRILFGSDMPWCSFNAMYYTVMDAQIDEDVKKEIMHHNFEYLLK